MREAHYYDASNFENFMSGTLVTIHRDLSIYGGLSEQGGEVRGNVEGNVRGNVDATLARIVAVIGLNALSVKEIMELMGLKGDDSFRKRYLKPAIAEGYVTMLYPDAAKRTDQACYLTAKGKELLKSINL